MTSEKLHTGSLYIYGGICGIAATLCYVIAITIPMSLSITYAVIMGWPVLSIIFIYSLYRFIKIENDVHANRLTFLMACIGFSIVAVMISAQLAVGAGIEELKQAYSIDQETLKFIKRSVRMVDMGIDVAWDCFIGTSLIMLFFAMKGHRSFGYAWGLPAILLGLVLIILNIITFPWPPAESGLFDVGPVIALYIIILGVRLTFLGLKIKKVTA